jgi:predicted phosphohydrolase
MKVFAISDLHLSFSSDKPMDIFGSSWENYTELIIKNWNAVVSDEDIVLLAGDLSWAMTLDEAVPDINFVASQKGKKVIVRGNHDYWWKSVSRLRDTLPQGFYALQNDCLKIGGYVICGTRGWTCPDGGALSQEDNKIYLREAQRLKLSLECAAKIRQPSDKLICMMHFPPFNAKREPSLFTDLIREFKADCVVYGHLHGKDCRADKIVRISGIPYYITSCDIVGNTLVRLY